MDVEIAIYRGRKEALKHSRIAAVGFASEYFAVRRAHLLGGLRYSESDTAHLLPGRHERTAIAQASNSCGVVASRAGEQQTMR